MKGYFVVSATGLTVRGTVWIADLVFSVRTLD